MPHPALQACADTIGAGAIATDTATLAEFTQDLIEWPDAHAPLCVARPCDTAGVAAIVRIAARFGLALAPRGGGMSYTAGYVPTRPDVIALDLGALNAIDEINPTDLVVTAGAGTTWQQLADALRPHRLRVLAPGPISGSHATIGGAAAQNVLGSMDAFIGLEVVLANGEVVRTGSAALSRQPSAFYRYAGPDLTGLFLGDTGALGIKTKVSLRLEPIPVGVAFASYTYPTLATMTHAMVEVARRKLAPRALGLDAPKNRAAAAPTAGEAIEVLGRLAREGTNVLRSAATLARAGELAEAPWSLHYTLEADDQPAADRARERLGTVCTRDGGQSIAPAVPTALHARPYSIRGFLGRDGERWIPVSGVFPLSRAIEIVGAIEALLAERASRLSDAGITWSIMTATEGTAFLVEPMFYWPDAHGPLHRRLLSAKHRARFGDPLPNPAARAVVVAMRAELRDRFRDWGAVHAQIGKFYDYAAAVEPSSYATLSAIKRALDPGNRLNPGNFGWS